ncbi:MAG: hypothetical protein GY716_00385 [bacterium]|nr:hypothetical protein [bacterium]
MARAARSAIQLEWFSVRYRTVFGSVGTLVALVLAAGAAWFWFFMYVPRAGASGAISQAETSFSEAARLRGDERVTTVVSQAETALIDARQSYASRRYEEARLSARKSETWALQAIRTVGGEGDSRQASFFHIEGDVRVKRAGKFNWEQATDTMKLEIGDQIKTSSSGSAQLTYFDGTQTTVQPGSLLEIRELYEDPVTKVRRVKEKLNFGEVKASTQKRNVNGSYHEVATDKATARAEDAGEFRVTYNKEKKTGRFDVFEGRIEVEAAGTKESVVAGEGIRSTSSGKLSAKKALPIPPRLISPRDQRVFVSEGEPEHSVTLNWQPVPGAKKYHLLIADKPLFTKLLYEGDQTGTHVELEEVGSGSYHWKVASIFSDVKSEYSDPRRFRISSEKIRDKEDTVPPVLEITEFVQVGMMVIVNGRTEPGASLWVDEEKIDVYDDGSFYQVIRLRDEGSNKLRFVAQDTAGNETVENRDAHLEYF